MRRLGKKNVNKREIPLYIKEEERAALRKAGQFNASVLDLLRPHVKAGVTTAGLDDMAREYILDHGHKPACLGYRLADPSVPPYPRSLCTSINSVVCHGIPDDTTLQDGDIVNIDSTVIVDGFHGDSSETFMIGDVSDEARELVQTTHDALWLAINTIEPRMPVIEIGYAIKKFVQPKRYGIVQEFQGHGTGRNFHEGLDIPHFPNPPSRRDSLRPGACFTIEPMLNLRGREVAPRENDGWTVHTRDRSLSAQFEHTILMTESGPEPLTLTKDGPQEGHVF